MQRQLYLPFTADELFGDRWEYLLLASPNDKVTAKVMEEKERFYLNYKQKIAIETRPHITVAYFKANRNLEETLVAMMQSACSTQPRFLAELNDFDGFRPHAIYIKVQEHQPFHGLASSLTILNDYLYENKCSIAYLVTEPHMTIARQIPYRVYIKAIDDYLNRSFSDSFWVHELLLLRRRHSGETYKTVTTLPLPRWSGYSIG